MVPYDTRPGPLNPARLNLNTSPPRWSLNRLVDGQVQNSEALRAAPPQTVTVPARKEGPGDTVREPESGSPGQRAFKYQLEGFETPPKERLGNVREVLYGKLPPGDIISR